MTQEIDPNNIFSQEHKRLYELAEQEATMTPNEWVAAKNESLAIAIRLGLPHCPNCGTMTCGCTQEEQFFGTFFPKSPYFE